MGRVLRTGEGLGGGTGEIWIADGRADLLFVEIGGVARFGGGMRGDEVDVTVRWSRTRMMEERALQSFSVAVTHA